MIGSKFYTLTSLTICIKRCEAERRKCNLMQGLRFQIKKKVSRSVEVDNHLVCQDVV